MRTIYKYQFRPSDPLYIDMPAGADIIHVASQNGINTLWSVVDTDWVNVTRRFRMVGTGHPLPADVSVDTHVATWMDGEFVWHLFGLRAPLL